MTLSAHTGAYPVPRNKPSLSPLAQVRVNLPDRPSQGWVAERVSEITGEEVSQQAVGYWETGKVDLRNVHPRRLRAYAEVLDVSLAELARLAGHSLEDLFPDMANSNVRTDETALPTSLLEAAQIYGRRFPDLLTLSWQAYLATFKARGARMDTAEEWLDLYRDLAKHGITPGGN